MPKSGVIAEAVIGMSVDSTGVRVGLQAAADQTKKQAAVIGNELRTQTSEAKASARLLGEELGVTLNRHLAAVAAKSQLLGPLLQAAFPIAVGLGFAEVIGRIPGAVQKLVEDFYGLGEAQKENYKQSVDQNKELMKLADEHTKLLRDLGDVGLTSTQKAQKGIQGLREEADKLHTSLMLAIAAQATLALQAYKPGSNVRIASAALSTLPLVGPALGGAGDFYADMFANKQADKDLADNQASIMKFYNEWQNKILETQVKARQLNSTVGDETRKAFDQVGQIYLKADATFQSSQEKLRIETGNTLSELAELWNKYPTLRAQIEEAAVRVMQTSDEKQLDLERQLQNDLLNLRLQANAKLMQTVFAVPALQDPWKQQKKDLQDLQKQFEETFGTEHALEQQVTAEAQTGGQTQYELAAKLADIRRQSQGQLADILAKITDINAQLKDPDVAEKIKRMGAEIDTLSAKSATAGATIRATFTNSLEQAFSGIVSGTQTASSAFKQMAQAIIGEIARIIAQMLILRTVTPLLGGLFGGGLAGLGNPFSAFVPLPTGIVTGHAGGGSMAAGDISWVGENGPELFVPDSSGTIVPNGAFGGGNSSYYDFRGAHFGGDPAMTKQAVAQAMKETEDRAVARADRMRQESARRGMA